MDESTIQQQIQIEAPAHRCQLLRNNSGALQDISGRTVRFGLGNISKRHSDRIKSSDLIGFKTVQITPDMVGNLVAIFVAVEVKREGAPKDKRWEAQEAFINWVKAAGGLAGFANSIESFRKIIGV